MWWHRQRFGRSRQEDPKFKVILRYIVSSKPAWIETLPQTNKQTLQREQGTEWKTLVLSGGSQRQSWRTGWFLFALCNGYNSQFAFWWSLSLVESRQLNPRSLALRQLCILICLLVPFQSWSGDKGGRVGLQKLYSWIPKSGLWLQLGVGCLWCGLEWIQMRLMSYEGLD